MTDSKYKIGIDFHGVITEAPVFFRDFAALALDKGYEIYGKKALEVVREHFSRW